MKEEKEDVKEFVLDFVFDCWWALLEEGKQGPAIYIIYWNSYAVAACNAR